MEHFYQSIEGNMDFEQLYSNAVRAAKDGAVFVEVGAYKGRSAAYMATEIVNSRKDIEFHVVDLWDEATFLRDMDAHPYEPATLAEFEKNVLPVNDKICRYQDDSAHAAEPFEETSVDFVFIDGDHRYEGVKRDILAWLPKVKPGGVIAGHDHTHEYPGVVRAVAEIFGSDFEVHGSSWLVRR